MWTLACIDKTLFSPNFGLSKISLHLYFKVKEEKKKNNIHQSGRTKIVSQSQDRYSSSNLNQVFSLKWLTISSLALSIIITKISSFKLLLTFKTENMLMKNKHNFNKIKWKSFILKKSVVFKLYLNWNFNLSIT